MIQLSTSPLSVTQDTVGIHRRCCQGELRSTDQPDARQQVHYQGLTSKCWSHHTVSVVGRPKMPDIMVGMVRKNSCVEDELKNKRGVLALRYPVEHGTATDWDDAGKGVDYLIVLVRGVEIDADSRTTATVNRNGLRVTPWKQDSIQRELHEVLSRQQFHFRRASMHRVLDRSADPLRRIHQRRDAVLHRSHRHQKSSMEHEEIPLTPSTRRQPDERATSA